MAAPTSSRSAPRVYEMLTGAPPFAGGDLNTILKQVLSDPTPPPSSRNRAHAARASTTSSGKALAKDPADRYQTAEEMAHDLRAFRLATAEFDTPAPAPLPALEHPTTPFHVSDLLPRANEPLAPVTSDPDATLLPPAPRALPWWRGRTGLTPVSPAC